MSLQHQSRCCARLIFFVVLFLFVFLSPIQAQKNIKNAEAIRISQPPRIDGNLDEDLWGMLPVMSDFVQYNPQNGRPATQKTEVRLCYDDKAIYIGAFCYDDSPDLIMKELRFRDDRTGMNADELAVNICPFNDSLITYFFCVSAANVQRDSKFNVDEHDISWDAVWDSRVSFTETGWSVEIKIPFSALRFSSESEQDWGLNFWRWFARNREWDTWSFVDVSNQGWWKQNGELKGFKDIDPPLNLSLTPYVSGYGQKGISEGWGLSYNGGMDLKWGITDSFTLDVTLIPDFSQIQSDDILLNLTPYEIKYNEKRQFFTEGTELFNKGDVFYSRRIGSTPARRDRVYTQLGENERVTENPDETRLINATKFSGRTNKGLGLGMLNAMTANSHAVVLNTLTEMERKIQTQPFTNHNIFVLDQTLFSNSYISLINTNVLRMGYTANVTATEFKLADRSNAYRLTGIGAVSHIREDLESSTGYKASMKAGKYGGKFLYEINFSAVTDLYDQNDLGYLRRNNEVNGQMSFEYNVYEPFSIFRGLRNRIDFTYNRMYMPSAFAEFSIKYALQANFNNYYDLDVELNLTPVERQDFYETRTPGRFFKNHKFFQIGFNLQTDERKLFSLRIQSGYMKSYDYDFAVSTWEAVINPVLRLSNQLNIGFESHYTEDKNQPGFVDRDIDSTAIYFGKRNRNTLENIANASFILNNRMSLLFRARHYWALAEYDSYYNLKENGRLVLTDFTGDQSINYNIFNIDMTFRWNFAPGSEILLNWKNSISSSEKALIHYYWDNLKNILDAPQVNSISLKVIYYFDGLFK